MIHDKKSNLNCIRSKWEKVNYNFKNLFATINREIENDRSNGETTIRRTFWYYNRS